MRVDAIIAQEVTESESSTMSVFLHVTTSERPRPYWGSILKSNSNGTYYSKQARRTGMAGPLGEMFDHGALYALRLRAHIR